MENGPMECWTVAFSPDGKKIISGSNAGKIHVYNVETGQQEEQLDTRGKYTLSIAYVRNYFTIYNLNRPGLRPEFQFAPVRQSCFLFQNDILLVS